MGPRQKKREKERQHSSWPLFAFDRLTPTDDQSDHRHSEPEKKMFSTVFSESRVLPQKKRTIWIYKKSQKSNRKTPNCHKTKMRMKKKSSKQRLTPHTHTPDRSSTTYTHQFTKTSSLSIIHVIKSINQQNSQFSISTLLSSLYPNIRLQCLSISQSR